MIFAILLGLRGLVYMLVAFFKRPGPRLLTSILVGVVQAAAYLRLLYSLHANAHWLVLVVLAIAVASGVATYRKVLGPLVLALFFFAAPAFARDPVTGIEDEQDLVMSRLAAQSGKVCKVPRVRMANGKTRQVRSRAEVAKFRAHFACPSTGKRTGACPGWVADHVKALKHCGPDKSTNMAWQTVADAAAKDRFE